MHSLTQHLGTINHMLKYLKGNPTKGLMFRKTEQRGIESFVNTDWAGAIEDRRSTIVKYGVILLHKEEKNSRVVFPSNV